MSTEQQPEVHTPQPYPEVVPLIKADDLGVIDLFPVLATEAMMKASTDEARHGVLLALLGAIEEARILERERAQTLRLERLQAHQIEKQSEHELQLQADLDVVFADDGSDDDDDPESEEETETRVLLVQVVADEDDEDGEEDA